MLKVHSSGLGFFFFFFNVAVNRPFLCSVCLCFPMTPPAEWLISMMLMRCAGQCGYWGGLTHSATSAALIRPHRCQTALLTSPQQCSMCEFIKGQMSAALSGEAWWQGRYERSPADLAVGCGGRVCVGGEPLWCAAVVQHLYNCQCSFLEPLHQGTVVGKWWQTEKKSLNIDESFNDDEKITRPFSPVCSATVWSEWQRRI